MQKILFNDKYGLTYEVLSGKKTQTRRIIPEASLLRTEAFKEKYFDDTLDVLEGKELLEQFFLIDEVEKPQYHKGEVVAIAQPYQYVWQNNAEKLQCKTLEEVAKLKRTAGWTNKMFVRADLMLTRIRITDIRIQRLQDISDKDCLAEGIRKWTDEKEYASDNMVRKSVNEILANGHDAYAIPGCWDCYTSPKKAYAALIDKISGKGTWEKNPWMFVYEFELVK